MSTTIPTFEEHLIIEPPSMKFTVADTKSPGLNLGLGLPYPSNSLRFLKPLHSKTLLSQETVPQARVPLRVVIVGAGLGGLATSIALARRGHFVLVLEQAHKLGEVGLSRD
jgi:salicylate hydroxylase